MTLKGSPSTSVDVVDVVQTIRKRTRSDISHKARGITVRPPKWYKSNAGDKERVKLAVDEFHRLQAQYLDLFRAACDSGEWNRIHDRHFDWWQFPIDDGSREEFNVRSESEVDLLRSHPDWLTGYRESVKLVAKAWGWDIEEGVVMKDAGFWDKKDVRLAKMIRSLWLFEQADYFQSLQRFAQYVNENQNKNRGLFYGRICLDEVLYMELPRRYFEFVKCPSPTCILGF